MLKLNNISKNYVDSKSTHNVFQEVNFEVRRGEVVSLVGPSGSGKSTLLHIIGLLDIPSTGDINFLEYEYSQLKEKKKAVLRNQQLGYIYQFHYLLKEFSLLENVMLPLRILGRSSKEGELKAAHLLKQLGIFAKKDSLPGEISGGEQQRAAIARSLINSPALILADEPTGNLDKANAQKVFDLFLNIAKKKNIAILFATHNMELAARSDKILKLNDRRLIV